MARYRDSFRELALSPSTEEGPSEALASTADAGTSSEASDLTPLWFRRGLTIATAGLLSFGGFGLLLAVLGVYHFVPVLIVGAILTAGLSALAWPKRLATGRAPARVTVPAIVLCAGVAAFIGGNAYYRGSPCHDRARSRRIYQHREMDRGPWQSGSTDGCAMGKQGTRVDRGFVRDIPGR